VPERVHIDRHEDRVAGLGPNGHGPYTERGIDSIDELEAATPRAG